MQAGVHRRVDYLEHEDGSGVSPDTLAVICQTMHNRWTTLAKCDPTPQSWGIRSFTSLLKMLTLCFSLQTMAGNFIV
ncbi:hypothetical protein PAXRUDRAFT_766058 [Paxillus rubicundulus Ve08.2h10]|uniref:Uncharacterized protein n=1 Tax=Paxillus rubicundulus Ve08.2h10 TaxID=930991 RepID=A0A0D0CCA4_9AGAM|nr:hypothetical protein PAXRUDRAFT_766058 [Paxillus rubicundulus Ve08.2h10]